MKTNKEILDFFGVEKGKKYIVTKDTIAANIGETFTIEVDGGGQLYINYGVCTSGIFALAYIEYAEVKEILTDKEKKYLAAAIGLLKKEVDTIVKVDISTDEEGIDMHTCDSICEFPSFKKGKKYKNMEINKEYTLEELGL